MLHNVGLRCQIVVELIVGNPVKRVPQEDGTGLETAADLIYIHVIKLHPVRALGDWDSRWPSLVPEICTAHVSDRLHRIQIPATSCGVDKKFYGWTKD